MAAYYRYSQLVPLCLCGHMSMKSEVLGEWALDFPLKICYIPVRMLLNEQFKKLYIYCTSNFPL